MAHGIQKSALDLRKVTTTTRRDKIQVVPDSTLYGHGYWPVEYCSLVSQPYFTGKHEPLPSTLVPGCILSQVASVPGVAGYHIYLPQMYKPQQVTSVQISPVSERTTCESSSPPTRAVEINNPLATPEYIEYEAKALVELAARNGGSLLPDNPNMRRAVQTSFANSKDDSYKRKREKNNASAKASRDKRKLNEMKLQLQVEYLKKKVAELEQRLAARRCSRCDVRECYGF